MGICREAFQCDTSIDAVNDEDREKLAANKRLKIRLAWGLLAGSAANAAWFFVTGGTSPLVIAILFAGLSASNFRSSESE